MVKVSGFFGAERILHQKDPLAMDGKGTDGVDPCAIKIYVPQNNYGVHKIYKSKMG